MKYLYLNCKWFSPYIACFLLNLCIMNKKVLFQILRNFEVKSNQTRNVRKSCGDRSLNCCVWGGTFDGQEADVKANSRRDLRQLCFIFSHKSILGQRVPALVTTQNSSTGVFKNKIRTAKKPWQKRADKKRWRKNSDSHFPTPSPKALGCCILSIVGIVCLTADSPWKVKGEGIYLRLCFMGLVITNGFLVTGIFHSGTNLSPASKSLEHIGVKVWLSSMSTERGASIPKGKWTHRYKQQDTWET